MNRNRYILALTLSLAVATIFGASTIYLHSKNSDYEHYIEAANRRSFSQLLSSLSTIDSSLQKMDYAYNGPTLTTLAASIWRESEVAKYALSALPLGDARLESYEKFIAQTGDYAFYLLKAASGGAMVESEQREALQSLSSVATTLSSQLSSMKERLDADDAYIQLRPGNLSLSAQPKGQALAENLNQTEQEFPEYAKLIYDGPFSEHINSLEPKMLTGLKDINARQAMEAAQAFLKTDKPLTAQHEGQGIIPYFSFSLDEHTTVEVSKRGGVIVSMCNNRELKTGRIDVAQALEKAAAFLVEAGHDSMKTSYYTVFENIVTINFAHVQDGVIVYPDLIKVGIALDDGTVVRYDAAGYIMNHHPRELPAAAESKEQSWAELPENLEVVDENTALIPTSGKNEVLCHEFVCRDANGRHVLIYINAQTGLQENILILIESTNGVLTF